MKELDATDFETEVLKSAPPVLVDFFSDRCPPCRLVAESLSELEGGTDKSGDWDWEIVAL